MWEIEATDEFSDWYAELGDEEVARINRAVDELAGRGPGLGRPWVDTITGSRYPKMKELRPRGGQNGTRCIFPWRIGSTSNIWPN